MPQRLSARQEECLRLTAFLTDKEIAVRLGLSETTVKKHVHEACRRLGVNRRKAALALLERNVPGPKDPIGGDGISPADASRYREIDNGLEQYAASPMDLGRPGGGAGRVQPDGSGSSGSRSPAEVPGGRRGGIESAGTAAAGVERGLGDGPGGRPERRFGYRPPPRSWVIRLLILLLALVLAALLIKAVADLLVAYTEQAQAIDRASSQDLHTGTADKGVGARKRSP
ncbi:MAG: helix-turn-helix transcriptional regulator [Brevundimonas sp.]|nr:helix-turn-helix transcriptional regulator [Brevundimonas sp.]